MLSALDLIQMPWDERQALVGRPLRFRAPRRSINVGNLP
jgi:hypothetical protein